MQRYLSFQHLWQASKCPLPIAKSLLELRLEAKIHKTEDFAKTSLDPSPDELFYMGQELLFEELVDRFVTSFRTIEADTLYEHLGESLRECGWLLAQPLQGQPIILESFIGGRPWPEILHKTQILRNLCIEYQGVVLKIPFLLFRSGIFYPVLAKASIKIRDSFVAEAELLVSGLKALGFGVGSPLLLHVNEDFVYQGEQSYSAIRLSSLAHAVKHLPYALSKNIEQIKARLANLVPCGKKGCQYCDNEDTRPRHHVSTLYKGGKAVNLLREANIESIMDIESMPKEIEAELTREHKIQIQAVKKAEIHLEKNNLTQWMQGLSFPILAIDFECQSSAVPTWNQTKAFEHLPFLVSVLKIEKSDLESGLLSNKPRTFSGSPGEDTREAILAFLVEVASEAKTVMGYGALLEKQVLMRGAQLFDHLKKDLLEMREAMVDLHEPFSKFMYYHYDQEGKTSLKKVLSLFSKLRYKDLEISDGGQAHIRWGLLSLDQAVKEQLLEIWPKASLDLLTDQTKVIEEIEEYAKLDVVAMFEVLVGLWDLTKK